MFWTEVLYHGRRWNVKEPSLLTLSARQRSKVIFHLKLVTSQWLVNSQKYQLCQIFLQETHLWKIKNHTVIFYIGEQFLALNWTGSLLISRFVLPLQSRCSHYSNLLYLSTFRKILPKTNELVMHDAYAKTIQIQWFECIWTTRHVCKPYKPPYLKK